MAQNQNEKKGKSRLHEVVTPECPIHPDPPLAQGGFQKPPSGGRQNGPQFPQKGKGTHGLRIGTRLNQGLGHPGIPNPPFPIPGPLAPPPHHQ
uniref:Uncharacterized protein n=1 Tax=Ochlerotatus taeniorhynchus TaxID=329105 RepID=B8XVP2_OCHTA|nr:hypothetical protein [Ochlerotatus taeniorhynchus]